LGQGLSVAQGFALVGKTSPRFDVYCITGDGELQEGPIWEAVMYAAHRQLDNLCVLVDQNNGQLDIVDRLIFPLPDLEAVFTSFGWQVYEADATQYNGVIAALEQFKHRTRNGKPTVILCHTTKGHGGFSNFMNRHKVVIPDVLIAQELALQRDLRQARIADFAHCYRQARREEQRQLLDLSEHMHLKINVESQDRLEVTAVRGPVRTKQVPARDKQIQYHPTDLPTFDKTQEYSASEVISTAMKVFAKDPRVVSIDADLASTSGLEEGIRAVDQTRALNVGVAEANMMNLGEAYAALGYNAWVSTFCPFFDWKVLRRIAVGYQERLEAIADPEGWLSEGHGLDLTFVATAPNFETKTNGATHMGNDDITIFAGMAHLKIIDVSCPQQLLGIMRWIMEGDKGLVYMRVMRAPSGVIYNSDFSFTFAQGYILRESKEDQAVIISSGRGVHEILTAADLLAERRIAVGVVDMPSYDEALLYKLYRLGKPVIIAEQNNGYLWSQAVKSLFRSKQDVVASRLIAINTLTDQGQAQFIHSATYGQLLHQFGLAPEQIAVTVQQQLT
jgi:transketolase